MLKCVSYRGLFLFYVLFFLSSLVFSQTATQDGEWGVPVPFGIVPVAVANLPDGRLITWSSQFPNTFREIGDGVTFTQLFDPGANGGLGASLAMRTTQTDHDMFCPGINNLADGRILSAGGTTSERTSIYDPLTDRWSRAADMNIPRGYQGNVTLPSGAVFTVGGSWSGGAGNNGGKAAELWTPGSGWINLPNISGEDIYTANDLALENQTNPFYRVDNHVWLWPAPNGGLFHAGPSEMMHWIDTDVPGGAITPAGLRGNDTYSMKGTTVMFDVGKILKVGGATSYGQSSSSTTPAKDNSFVIDINVPYGQAPTVIDAGDLQYERTMHNSTVLPNGQVLVTGGLDRAAVFTDAGAQLEAELYTPSPSGGAGTWRTVAGMQVPRTYHSVAILMTDGRVFVGGGGLCDGTPDCVNHFSAEIYSPPYLFGASGNLASRPVITSVSGNTLGNGPYGNNPLVDYGDVLQVNTDVPVGEFSLVRFSAATHSTNNEQRRIPLTTTAGTSHNLTVPGRNLLPPGYYMLFALDADGVPSVSRTLRIGTALPLDVNPNLVLDMRFDETSGNLLADSSVNGNDGTVVQRSDTGAPVAATDHGFVDGLFGNAIAFEGREHNSNSLIEIPYDDSFASVRGAVTLSAWVWRDADSGIPDAGGKIANVAVLGHDYQDGSGAGGIFFGFHNTLYKWSFRTTSGYYDNYAGYAPLAGWNHVAATYDGRTSKLYANGVLVGSVAASGDLVLNGDTADELSSFTVSGFYDQRPLPVRPYGNRSGITDEVDGRMDELKVFSSALGQDEIRTMFERGLATGNIAAAGCQGSYLVPEYSINEGEWRTDSNNRIVATEGDRVRVRALGHDGAYFLTTQIVDGPTFASASDFDPQVGYRIDTDRPGAGNPLGDGLVDVDDRGLYTMTTPDGCPTTFFIEVLGKCDPGETEIFTEYKINESWLSGGESITVLKGERLQLSVLPNIWDNPEIYPIQIILPNGNRVEDNFVIESISLSDTGIYRLTSAQGCTKTIEVMVDEDEDEVEDPDIEPDPACEGLIIPEYRLNGVWSSGNNLVSVSAGTEVLLSMLPNGVDVTIEYPDGRVFGDNHSLGQVDSADAGIYKLTSAQGCTATIEVMVEEDEVEDPDIEPDPACEGLIIPEYRLNGVWSSGNNLVSVSAGTEVLLSMLPNGVDVTIEYPDGRVFGDNHSLGQVDSADAGIYKLTSAQGCTATIEVMVEEDEVENPDVEPDPSCEGLIIPEYRLNGVWSSGDNLVSVSAGTEVLLSMLPNGVDVTIEYPDGRVFGDNHSLGQVDSSDSGTYTVRSAQGCITLIKLSVDSTENSSKINEPISSIVLEPNPSNVNDKMTISPNPVENYLFINFSSDFHALEIEVVDALGRSIQVSKVDEMNKQEHTFNLGFLNSGVYYIKVTSITGQKLQKMIVVKN